MFHREERIRNRVRDGGYWINENVGDDRIKRNRYFRITVFSDAHRIDMLYGYTFLL